MFTAREISGALFDRKGRPVYGALAGYERVTNHAAEFMNVPRAPADATTDDDLTKTFRFGNDGDLVSDCFLEVAIPAESGPTNVVDIVHGVTLRIGGEVIDRHTGAWMKAGLFVPRGSRESYETMTTFASPPADSDTKVATLPLAFWFCRSPDLALPLTAITKQHVEIEVEFVEGARVLDAELVANMVYVDEDERATIVDAPRSLLIDTVQASEFDVPTATTRFDSRPNFRGPVKLVCFSTPAPVAGASLLFNGVQRFGTRSADFWGAASTFWNGRGAMPGGMYAMPLCADPWSHQPTGATNASLLEKIDLRIDLTSPLDETVPLTVLGLGYNFLLIKDGRAALLGPRTV